MNTLNRVLAVVAASSATSLLAAEWPQYRGAAGDGSTQEALAWTAGSLEQVWKVPADSGFSSFTVSGGKAYTQVLREVDGAKQETLVALDAATGKEVWHAVFSPVKPRRKTEKINTISCSRLAISFSSSTQKDFATWPCT